MLYAYVRKFDLMNTVQFFLDKQDLRTQSNCVQPGGSNDELWASSEVGAGCCGSQAATSSVLGAPPSAIDRRPAHNLDATTRSSARSAN